MRIATATVTIDPSRPATMGGYDGAPRMIRQTAGTLEANIVMFEEGTGAFAIVAVDTLFAGADMTHAITAEFAAAHGLAPERVLVLASHTHFSPMLDRGKPRIGAVTPSALDETIDRIAMAIRSLTHGQARSVAAGTGASDCAVNRRRRWRWPTLLRATGRTDSPFYMADNPRGRRDRRIRTALYCDAHGVPLVLLWTYACHPVAFPTFETASPEFPGVVRTAVRERFGDSLPVVFMPGCMGDVRPRSPQRPPSARRAIEHIVYGPRCAGFTMPEWKAWTATLAKDVLAAVSTAITQPLDPPGAIAAASASLPLSELIAGRTAVERFSAKAAVVPGIGRIVALSCEPVTAIADVFARTPDDWIVGYEGDVFGYLPNEEILAQGGYEATRFMPFFGIEGAWRARLDDRLSAFAVELRV